jgi:hypothetical protein
MKYWVSVTYLTVKLSKQIAVFNHQSFLHLIYIGRGKGTKRENGEV